MPRSPIVQSCEVRCVSSREELWPVLSDTDRVTRLVGGSPITLDPTSGQRAARFIARSKVAGFTLEYEEAPFEWVYPKRWQIIRRFRKGPLTELVNTLELTPLPDGGATARVEVSMMPRRRLLGFLIRRSVKPILEQWRITIGEVDEALQRDRALPAQAPLSDVNDDALQRAAALLSEHSPAWSERLSALVRSADEATVSQLRPFAIADDLGEPPREALGACMHAVRAGLLEMRWGVICPSCQTAAATVPSLSDLGEHGSCHLCDIDFDIDLEEAVEALFRPNPAVRDVDPRLFCSGGPARSPHVLSQRVLPPADEVALELPEQPGRYRLFVRGGEQRLLDVQEGAGAPEELRLQVGALRGDPLAARVGGRVLLSNPGAQELHAKIEEANVSRARAATALDVTTMPGFRRDFSSQLLRPGLALEVKRVSLLFTDLTGSTEFYRVIGDAAAFSVVQDHFSLLFDIIERHDGDVVKTIGDAIMAVFPDELEGLRASLDILRAFPGFRERLPEGCDTHIKLGLYSGPCYAVTANDQLDYFGQSCNIAARLQGEAGRGELVLTEASADALVSTGHLPEALIVSRREALLKGLDATTRVVHIRTASDGPD